MTDKTPEQTGTPRKEIEGMLAWLAERMALFVKATQPFTAEVEKELSAMMGERVAFNDPRVDDATLDDAMTRAMRRIFDDAALDVDAVSLPEVLAQIEKNKQALAALKNFKPTQVNKALQPLSELFDRAFSVTLDKIEQALPPLATYTPPQTTTPAKGKKSRKVTEAASVTYSYRLEDAEYVRLDREKKTIAIIDGNGDANIIISNEYNDFDQRVCQIIGSIWDSGGEYFTASEVQTLMNGSSTKATTAQTRRIETSIAKQMLTRITIDTANEQHLKRHSLTYRGMLLPCETIQGRMKNKVTTLIHLFREPPLITFCKERQQITTYPIRVLQSPLKKTDNNIALENYLLKRVSHMNHSKDTPRVILFESLFDACHANEGKNPSRDKAVALENADAYLTHLKECGVITGYKIDKKAERVRIFPK